MSWRTFINKDALQSLNLKLPNASTPTMASIPNKPNKKHLKIAPKKRTFRCFVEERALLDVFGLSSQSTGKSYKYQPEMIDHLIFEMDSKDEKFELLFFLTGEVVSELFFVVVFFNLDEDANMFAAKIREMGDSCVLVTKNSGLCAKLDQEPGKPFLLITTDMVHGSTLATANLVINFDIPTTSSVYMKRASFASRYNELMRADDDVTRCVVMNLQAGNSDVQKLTKIERELELNFDRISEDN